MSKFARVLGVSGLVAVALLTVSISATAVTSGTVAAAQAGDSIAWD